MNDYIKRILIAVSLAMCVSLLFLGTKQIRAAQADQWIWPADGVISDSYGSREGKHKGIDIAGDLNSPVYSVDEGKVIKSYYSESYGNVIFIKHSNQYETIYAHLNERIVREGDTVSKGQVIGKMGNTGESTGVHLHFEVHDHEWTFEKENALNPESLLGKAALGTMIQALSPSEGVAVTVLEHSKTENVIIHVVKNGETLWAISQTYETTVEALLKENALKDTTIVPSQSLRIPIEKNGKYVVKSGDTLSAISREYKIPIEKVKELNKLSSDIIQPEQILVLK